MRARVWLTSLVLASFAIACGDQMTEVVPDRDGGMAAGPGGVALATSSTEDGLSITTNKDDYAPGDTVWFTGAGWPANDVLDIVLTDDPTHDYHEWTVEVGADGTFRDSTYVVDLNDLGVTFTLTATSRATGQSLTVVFTDNITSISVTLNSTSVPPALVVAPNTVVSLAITANVRTGAGAPTSWNSTGWVLQTSATAPTGKLANCVDTENQAGSGGGGTETTRTFDITAPITPGTYNLFLALSDVDGTGSTACGGGGGTERQGFNNVLTVQAPDNQPPTAEAGGPYSGNEGSAILLDGSGSTDVDGTIVNYSWSIVSFVGASPPADGGGSCSFVNGENTGASPSVTCTDNGTLTVRLTVTDDDGGTGTDDATVTVNNVAPVITSLSVAPALVPVNTQVDLSATFTDDGANDTHTASINWDDGAGADPGTVTPGSGSGSVSGSNIYTSPGIYVVTLTVTDDDGDSDTETFEYVVVYDPSAGFVTGGGWINSPAGAYVDDPTLTGKATFGFVSKYQKGANVPTGNTEFQFHAADLNFKSTSYDWLVVQGGSSKATFKGYGSVNGVAGYGFLLSAADGSPDKFRIKIWETGGDVIYDNNIGGNTGDNADPATAISGGSIVIHVPKK